MGGAHLEFQHVGGRGRGISVKPVPGQPAGTNDNLSQMSALKHFELKKMRLFL